MDKDIELILSSFKNFKDCADRCRVYKENINNDISDSDIYYIKFKNLWTDSQINIIYNLLLEICSLENNKCVPLADSPNPLLSVERMKISIERLLEKNVNVTVLDATPDFKFLVPKEISRQVFLHNSFNNAYDESDHLEKNRDFDKLFLELSKNSKFHLISLRPKLCKENKCYIFDEVNNVAIYKDRDHLNPKWLIQNGDILATIAH